MDTQTIEDTLLEAFNFVQANDTGYVLIAASPRRTHYLYRRAVGIADRYAKESILMFPPGDPLIGLGPYYNLRFRETAKGLLISRENSPDPRPSATIIRAALAPGDTRIRCDSQQEAATLARTLSNTLGGMQSSEKISEVQELFRRLTIHYIDNVIYITQVQNMDAIHELTLEDVQKLIKDD